MNKIAEVTLKCLQQFDGDQTAAINYCEHQAVISLLNKKPERAKLFNEIAKEIETNYI